MNEELIGIYKNLLGVSVLRKPCSRFAGHNETPPGFRPGRQKTDILIFTKHTGCFAPGCKLNGKALVCFCLFGIRPKIQATRFTGGR
jgi:hypothetical protein